MNLDIINKPCTEWSKETWQEAYSLYCKSNMFGPMDKRQYYNFVLERLKKQDEVAKPLSPNLVKRWIAGGKSAAMWAKKHGCNLRGRIIDKTPDPYKEQIEEIHAAIGQLNNKVFTK